MTDQEFSDMYVGIHLGDAIQKIRLCLDHVSSADKELMIRIDRDLGVICGRANMRLLDDVMGEFNHRIDEVSKNAGEVAETPKVGENTQTQLPQDNAEAMAAAVDYADGWRPWGGHEWPPCLRNVLVVRRDGKESIKPVHSYSLRWSHNFSGSDIVAWKPA